mmetsp:Transcript_9850/g.19954  ORF Transcript_9850/g.19954 Transcript_9850/m.19954 type:complete len:442 (-) Transcript_9850:331-1656(-)
MTVTEDGSKVSCVSGFDRKESTSTGADASVGGLYAVSGALLSRVPPAQGAAVVTIDEHPVRLTVLESGDLQVQSLLSTNNRVESVKNSRQGHRDELEELRGTAERLATERLEAEEQYGSSLGGTGNPGDTRAQEYATSLLQLVAQERSIAQKLLKLENSKEITVTFTTQGGTTASLQPGIVTAVPFAAIPLVWCPNSLARARPLDDTEEVALVPIFGLLQETPSKILSEDMLRDLSSMIPGDNTDSMVLHKLHDQSAGITATHYDKAVRPHGNVLTVIQSSDGRVFGGFFVDPMGNGSGWYKGHEDDFLFTLGKKDQNARVPVKLLKPQGYSKANALHRGSGLNMGDFLFRGKFCGLHMGDLTAFASTNKVDYNSANVPYMGQGDLAAFKGAHNLANVPTVYCVPAPGYPNLPQGESIAGTRGNFTPTNMEVYQLRAASQK